MGNGTTPFVQQQKGTQVGSGLKVDGEQLSSLVRLPLGEENAEKRKSSLILLHLLRNGPLESFLLFCCLAVVGHPATQTHQPMLDYSMNLPTLSMAKKERPQIPPNWIEPQILPPSIKHNLSM